MVLAGSGGIYEILLILLVVILILNGLKRQKIMNKVEANLEDYSSQNAKVSTKNKKENIQEGEYIDFEETSE